LARGVADGFDQARLADAGFAADHDRASVTARAATIERGGDHRQLGSAPDEWTFGCKAFAANRLQRPRGPRGIADVAGDRGLALDAIAERLAHLLGDQDLSAASAARERVRV